MDGSSQSSNAAPVDRTAGWALRSQAGRELTSPDQLDVAIGIVSPVSWLALTVVSVLVAGALAWGMVGWVVTLVKADGLFVYQDARHIDIETPREGYVSALTVRAGERVEAGQVVAWIEPEYGQEEVQAVRAPVAGEIVDVIAGVGTFMRPGGRLYQMTNRVSTLSVVAFMTADQARTIEAGMPVQVWPGGTGRRELGGVRGVVRDVVSYRLSPEALKAIVGKAELAQRFSRPDAPALVEIDLMRNGDGDVAWVAGRPAAVELGPGMLATVDIAIARQHPIALGIPALREMWDGE